MQIFTTTPTTANNISVGDIWVRGGKVLTCTGINPVVWMTSQNDVQSPGNFWYVNSVSGSNTNDGKGWSTAFATIATAVAAASAGDVIMAQGSFSEAVTITLAGLTILGVGTGPNQTIWTSATDTACLTINATDCLIQNIEFRPPAYTSGIPAAIVLGGANYTRIIGNRFQGQTGSYIAVYSPVCNSDNVVVQGNEFIYLNNITTVYGSAILGVEAGGLSYSSWVIKNNDFNAPVQGINICGRGCLIEGNDFRVNGLLAAGTMGAVTGSAGSMKMIDLSGTNSNCNHVHGNYFGGTYSGTLYTKSAGNDDWAGNFNIAGITAANPV